MKLTWLESTAEVWPAVTLTLTDGSLCSTGGVHCALAPNTHLIRAALLILDAGLCEDTQSDMLKKSMSSASFWIHVDSITSRHKGHFFFFYLMHFYVTYVTFEHFQVQGCVERGAWGGISMLCYIPLLICYLGANIAHIVVYIIYFRNVGTIN